MPPNLCPGHISSETVVPLGRLSGVREPTVLSSPVELSEVPGVASGMSPILLKKFLESVPQTTCSGLHAMLWLAEAAEMN